MAVRVAAIGYRELADLFRNATQRLNPGVEVEVHVYDARMHRAVEIARDLEDRGEVDVFVSGGANVRLLKRYLQSPVVGVAVSAFDLMRAVKRLSSIGGRIAVVSFEQPIEGLADVLDMVPVPVEEIVYSEPAELHGALAVARQKGIVGVVGSSYPCEVAREYGMPCSLVYSEESIRLATRTAIEVALSRYRELAKAEQLRTVLNFTFGGIVATDRDGVITHFNPTAERILGLRASDVIGRKVSQVIQNSRLDQVLETREAELNQVQQIGSVTIVTNRVPVVVGGEVAGAVATFLEASMVERASEELRQARRRKGFVARATLADIVHESPVMKKAVDMARRFAPCDLTVLITGESGAGKELFAQGIHNASRRADGPFVAINCAALPENLLESELFGYEDGAFTGARRGGKEGLFEMAHRGSIFLDEIGGLSPGLQAKLLRVLQEREVLSVGGTNPIPVDVRVIAATNQDLKCQVQAGLFREDLFYRLAVLRLHVPPLRERQECLVPLVARLLSRRPWAPTGLLEPASLGAIVRPLRGYVWPGNVRELENFLDNLIVALDGRVPPPRDLASIVSDLAAQLGMPVPVDDTVDAGGALDSEPFASSEQTSLRQHKDAYLRKVAESALVAAGGKRRTAARILGVSRTTLWRRLKG